MRITVLLAHVQEPVVRKHQLIEPVGIDIRVAFFLENLFADAALRIRIIHAENVLMTVERHHGQLVGGCSKSDARDVAVGIDRHRNRFDIFRFDAVGMKRDAGIFFAGVRIFIDIFARRIAAPPTRRNGCTPDIGCRTTSSSGSSP